MKGIEWGRAIGAGARARVFVARRHGQAVAVKVVPVASAKTFAREVGSAMVPVHQNLVQVLEGRVVDGRGMVVMQWVDGLDLELVTGLLRLHERRVPAPVAAFIVAQVLRGLDYVHHFDARGEAHGGVKASHVLLSICGEVKLTGHGQAHGAARADDVLGVGLVLHELLTGERTRTPAPGPRHAVPRPLDVLRQRLLAADPLDRPTVGEALAAIEAWGGHRDHTTALAELMRELTGVHRPRTIDPFDPRRPVRWHRIAVAAAAVLAIAAGALACW
jgi:hypothetical protein